MPKPKPSYKRAKPSNESIYTPAISIARAMRLCIVQDHECIMVIDMSPQEFNTFILNACILNSRMDTWNTTLSAYDYHFPADKWHAILTLIELGLTIQQIGLSDILSNVSLKPGNRIAKLARQYDH